MTPMARLAGISLDSTDPVALAAFYCQLLELEVKFESDDFVAVGGAGIWLTTQRVEDLVACTWPDATIPKQLHLELAVTDLDAAEARALGLGATKPDVQPSPDRWRVLIDPEGHPFCITTLIPDE